MYLVKPERTRRQSAIFRCVLASLYEGLSVHPSVRPSVRRSVGPSVRPSVTLSLKTGKSMILIANNDVSCNHIIIQSFHHHEDASLALWALFLTHSPTEKSTSLEIDSVENLAKGSRQKTVHLTMSWFRVPHSFRLKLIRRRLKFFSPSSILIFPEKKNSRLTYWERYSRNLRQ